MALDLSALEERKKKKGASPKVESSLDLSALERRGAKEEKKPPPSLITDPVTGQVGVESAEQRERRLGALEKAREERKREQQVRGLFPDPITGLGGLDAIQQRKREEGRKRFEGLFPDPITGQNIFGTQVTEPLRERGREAENRALGFAFLGPASLLGLGPDVEKTGETARDVREFIRNFQIDIAQSGGTIAASLNKSLRKSIQDLGLNISEGRDEIRKEDVPKLAQPVMSLVFGDKPIKSLDKRIEEGKLALDELAKGLEEGSIPLVGEQRKAGEALEKFSLPIALIGIPGIVALDFTGAGGSARSAARVLQGMKNVDEIIDFGKRIGIADDLVEPWARKIAKIDDIAEIEKSLNNLDAIQRSTRVVQEASGVRPGAAAARQTDEFVQPGAVSRAAEETRGILPSGRRAVAEGTPRAGRAIEPSQARQIEREAERATGEAITARVTREEVIANRKRASNARANLTEIRNRIQRRSKDIKEGFRAGRRASKVEIKEFQNEVIEQASAGLPTALRGDKAFLKKVRDANSLRGLEKAVDEVTRRIDEFEEVNRRLREKGNTRSKIAFIKKVGEFNQTVTADAKRKLGIEKPLSKMNQLELDSMLAEMQRRLAFKQSRGFQPGIKGKDTEAPQFTEDFYEEVRNFQGKSNEGFLDSTKKTFEDFGSLADEVAGVISTRLANIDPVLKSALRVFESNVRLVTQKDQKVVTNFLKKARGEKRFGRRRQGGMSQSDWLEFDIAAKNGDEARVTALAQKYGFEKELEDLRSMLDDLYDRAQSVGFDIGYRKGFFPRVIKDPDGLLTHISGSENRSAILEAIRRRENEIGDYLSEIEKSNMVNSMLRGYSGGQIRLSKTGNMKERVIDFVDAETNQFYAGFDDALQSYASEMNEAIEMRKLFGKEFPNAKDPEALNDVQGSIGAYTAKLLSEGKITDSQEIELSNILKARFTRSPAHPAVSGFRRAAYITILGGLDNAITQIGDLGLAVYTAGPRRASSAAVRNLMGKSRITKEDMGFAAEEISAEIEKGRLKSVLDATFRATGFRRIDRLGLETLANSTLTKFEDWARSGNTRLNDKLDQTFPEEIFGTGVKEQVIQDLQRGEITANVKFLAFNEILDFSPRALSEMPEKYLRHPNGRAAYMLQSWNIKLVDIYRRESFQEIQAGNVVKGLGNLLGLSASVAAMNATADTIKDIMLGREMDATDLAWDNVIKLTGFSRYTLYQAQREGVFAATAGELVAPAFPLVDDIGEDLINLYKDFDKSADINELRSIRNIPVGGDLYYWWFGKGVDVKERRQEKGLPAVGGSGGSRDRGGDPFGGGGARTRERTRDPFGGGQRSSRERVSDPFGD